MEQSYLKNILEKKGIPNKQVEIKIRFGKKEEQPQKPLIEETEEIQTEVEEIEGVEEEIPKEQTVKILDKRKTSGIDRQFILNRLKEQNMVLVKSNLISQKPTIKERTEISVPPIRPKKVIIKETLLEEIQIQEISIEPTTEMEKLTEPMPEVEKLTEATRAPITETIETVVTEPIETEQPTEPVAPSKKTRKRLVLKPTTATTSEILPTERVDLTTAIIRTQTVANRLPKEKEKIIIKAPSYYMNNRKIFIQKLSNLFNPYRQDLLSDKNTVSCDTQSQNTEFDLLNHQKIVRDYLNLYTPYRGLLLYHGLGSGKTCTSIAIAEGMKSDKRVFVLTPASLKMNFFSEMKKCGDDLYKKNQYWEFVSIEGNPQYVQILSQALSLPVDYIEQNKGAWLVNVNKKTPSFTDFSTEDQNKIDEQLNMMIRSKYTDINYNGLNMKKIDALTENKTKNPFHNSVVVIDEAHNFVSRIVNKIRKPNSISYILYDYLMNAQNTRIILLTGTPIINYPKEIAILFNTLRGYIKTWTMTVNLKEGQQGKINTDIILDLFQDNNFRIYDFVEYKGNKLTVTRNPFGFINTVKPGVAKGTIRTTKRGGGALRRTRKITSQPKTSQKKTKSLKPSDIVIEETNEPIINSTEDELLELQRQYNDPEFIGNNPYRGGDGVSTRYNGVRLNEQGNVSDDEFIKMVVSIMKKNFDVIENSIELKVEKALPDDEEKFIDTFVNAEIGEMKNINLFQRRILGLTSYFRSAQEELLPQYVKTRDGDIYHVEKTIMSEHQFGVYEKIRKEEADQERKKKQNNAPATNKENANELYKISSTYRIFSRAACNFTFPEGIDRPTPEKRADKEIDEMEFDVVPKNLRNIEDVYSGFGEDKEAVEKRGETIEEIEEDEEMKSYSYRIEKALRDVSVIDEQTNESLYLNKDTLLDLSPKFAKVLENLKSDENGGLHLLYSHFRTIEGIGILRLILLANGFAEFKLRKIDTNWEIEEKDEDLGKPRFVLYTGTESAEEKEIIRNVYNGAWDFIPTTISFKLREQFENNLYGEVIKIMMITSSGAEGINLKNTRFVHIIEPYWHMVRTEQVVGRARRICSHQDLPEDMRNVKVFLYVTTFSEQQKTSEGSIELRIRDVSRIDKKTPVTTDENLYEIASLKNRINNQFLKAIKETAIDCNIYSDVSSKNDEEPLICYGFGKVETNNFSSFPMFDVDSEVKEGLDVKTVRLKAIKVTIGGIEYALNETTRELYDYGSYMTALKNGTEPRLVGRLINQYGQYKIEKV